MMETKIVPAKYIVIFKEPLELYKAKMSSLKN